MKDIEMFLKNSKTQENEMDVDTDFDLDGDYLYPNSYPEPIEFSENVIEQGCIWKRKKIIYDEY